MSRYAELAGRPVAMTSPLPTLVEQLQALMPLTLRPLPN